MATEYFRQRMDEGRRRLEELEKQENFLYNSINSKRDNKKRKYREAMGYDNDYNCVQEPNEEYLGKTQGKNWIDAYSEQLFLKTTPTTKIASGTSSNHSIS